MGPGEGGKARWGEALRGGRPRSGSLLRGLRLRPSRPPVSRGSARRGGRPGRGEPPRGAGAGKAAGPLCGGMSERRWRAGAVSSCPVPPGSLGRDRWRGPGGPSAGGAAEPGCPAGLGLRGAVGFRGGRQSRPAAVSPRSQRGRTCQALAPRPAAKLLLPVTHPAASGPRHSPSQRQRETRRAPPWAVQGCLVPNGAQG